MANDKTKALATIKHGELSTPNKAVALSVPNEDRLDLSQELASLEKHLEQLSSDEKINLPAILNLVDCISATTKVSQKFSRVFTFEDRRQFNQMTLTSLRAALKTHRERVSLKDLEQQLEDSIPEESDEGGLTKSLLLLRRLAVFAGDSPAALVAISHSTRKLLPLIRSAKLKNNELLDADGFKATIIHPTIRKVAEFLNSKFEDSLAADLISTFTNDLADKVR